jgi:hypothetical protein
MKRPIKPRPTAAVMPLVTSTRVIAEWTGIPERRFREALARHPEVPRSALGRDVLLSPAAVEKLLAVLQVDAGDAAVSDLGEELATVDDVLRLVGRKTA